MRCALAVSCGCRRRRQDNLTAREALSEQQYLASTTAADLAPFPSSDDGDAARRAGSEDERAHRDDQSGGSDEDDAGDDDEDDDDDASFRAASLPAFSYLLESLSAARSGRETGVADTKSSEVLTTSSSTLAVDAGTRPCSPFFGWVDPVALMAGAHSAARARAQRQAARRRSGLRSSSTQR